MEKKKRKAPNRTKLGRTKQGPRWPKRLNSETKAIWDQGPQAWVAYMRECRAKKPPGERFRNGVPDGMRRAEANELWAQARTKADWIMAELEKEGVVQFNADLPEEQMARETLKEAFVMAMSPLTEAKTKTTAIRTVLEWTKAKPAQKTDLRLNNAEAWLEEVVKDHKSSDGKSE